MPDRFADSGPFPAPQRTESGESIAPEVMMMLLADARLPTGAHTQSAGLEPALRGGMPPAQVPRYIRARLRTVVAVEAGAAVLARARSVKATVVRTADLRSDAAPGLSPDPNPHPMRDPNPHLPPGLSPDLALDSPADPSPDPASDLPAALAAVDAAWRARTVSPELRETSVLLGRGYARLVRRLWPNAPAAQALSVMNRPGRAVVLGVAAALAGLSAAQLIRLIGYDDVQTVAAATLKLEPLDPVVTTGWVMSAGPDIERMVGELADIDDIEQMPAFGAPLIEQWAQIHATTSQRLFRA